MFYHLFVFDLSGNYITKIKNKAFRIDGFGIEQKYGDIYLCDNTNGQIVVLMSDYPFIYQFANGIIGHRMDIKLTNDYIYVISDKDPYLYSFSYNRTRIHTNISTNILKHFYLPFGIAIDGAGNLFLCNSGLRFTFIILDPKGKVLHKMRSVISGPLAITIDSIGRVIIVDRFHCIQIY